MTCSDASISMRPIGQTRLSVTELGFGAASLGNLYREVDDATAKHTLQVAIDAGMRYVDTAPYYGFGLSERRVGDVLRAVARDEFVLSTKVGRILEPVPEHEGSEERYGFLSPMPFEPRFDYSYDAIMRSFEDSMQRLGLARIDILFVHDIGTITHGEANDAHMKDLMDSGYRALDELRSGGLINAIGLGVNEFEICELAMEFGQFDCFLLAGRYTLLEQEALTSFLPKCASHGATVVIGGAYNSGILATGTRSGKTAYYNYAPAPESVIQHVRRIEAVCDAHGVELASAALQFPLAHAQVSCVIPGLGSPRRIAQTLLQYRSNIPSDFWSELKHEALVREDAPTPGGDVSP